METLKAIYERRSIRKYTDQYVSIDTIKELLKAGMCAPSAGNEHPWDFIVVRDSEKLFEITKVQHYSNMLKEAKVAIIVCGNLKKVKYQAYWIQDCSAASENILLAAHSLGLGAVWLGVYPDSDVVEGISKIFDLPQQVIPLSIISIGYPAEEKTTKDKYNEKAVHYDKW
ncbi:nitroreductase family protein [Clostridium sediminicola]|uniref:nitroreductase family protein n=1 Tax=Clostridium sediminicola TaxID=3114879 RepID=UPI0031F1C9F9